MAEEREREREREREEREREKREREERERERGAKRAAIPVCVGMTLIYFHMVKTRQGGASRTRAIRMLVDTEHNYVRHSSSRFFDAQSLALERSSVTCAVVFFPL